MRLTACQNRTLRMFRGTGRYVGRDARWRDRLPKPGVRLSTLMGLRRKGLLEHSIANRWYLTVAGQDIVYGRKP